VKFQVAFPDEIQWREYNYNHNEKGLYAFIATGSNRGRMYYLYDKEGKIIDLPKRDVWILLNEDFELQTEPDVIEERWIWGKYQPFRIDLSEIDALVIKNRISGKEKSFALQSTYRVEGEQLIEDDYKKEFPLFTGKTLKIVAPYENQSGWSVWIQNKAAGYKIKENWTGREPLTLILPDDLLCEFGEFQIDICQQNTRISDETLFFRLMPCIELNYPKELIIPNPKSGHIPLTISIRLDSNDEWELDNRGIRDKVKQKEHNFYEIELPPEEDTFRFILAKTSQPESIVNFQATVPRLKWKTSKQKMWGGISQKIERNDLKSGESFYLLIQTNDFDNKYDLSAILETDGQKIQEGKFIRKGMEYSLELNQFFDTIKHNKDELTIRVEIRKIKEEQLVGSVDTLYFEGEPKVQEKIPPQKPREKTTSKISNIQALVKCPGRDKQRRAKGFSKRELICAGIDLKDVRRLNIPYDRRRKSSHSWNIETLKALKGRLKIMAGGNNHAT
jgi:ribosomal protein L13E